MFFFRVIGFIVRGALQCRFLPRLGLILLGLYGLDYVIQCFKQIGRQ